jgi:hypothetical protein
MKKQPFSRGIRMIAGLFLLALVSLAGPLAMALCFTIPLVANIKAKGIKMDEHQEKFFTEIENAINTEMAKYLGQFASQKNLEDKLDAFKKEHGTGLTTEKAKELDDMIQSVKSHAAELQKLKDNGMKSEQGGAILKALQEKSDAIKTFIAERKGAIKIEVKSGASQAASDIATHTIGDRAPGIGQQPVRAPFMEDLFPVVNTTKEYIKYLDQETVVRDAKNVASAAASTHTTKLTWKERSIQIAAVRDLINVPIDMIEDYDFVEGEVRNLIDSSVQLKIDNDLLKGDGVHPNLHSVDEIASEFDATNTLGGTIEAWTGKVQAPNFFDLAVAMASQIIAMGKENAFMPNVILVNTIDKFQNMLIKDANDNYIMPPFVVRQNNKEYTVDGMVVRSNPNVDPNSMYVFDSTKATLYNRKGVTVEMSYENATNFETETVTLKAYRRLNLLIRNVNANAFMKCSDVDAALSAISSAA